MRLIDTGCARVMVYMRMCVCYSLEPKFEITPH